MKMIGHALTKKEAALYLDGMVSNIVNKDTNHTAENVDALGEVIEALEGEGFNMDSYKPIYQELKAQYGGTTQ